VNFDEALLDDAGLLQRLDAGRMLWSLASAGAQVRHSVQLAEQFEIDRLRGQLRPRSVLLVGDSPAKGALRVLARLVAPAAPVLEWSQGALPRWAGPADALLAAAVDGANLRVSGLLDQAVRRGLICAAVAPGESPTAAAAGRSPLAPLELSLNPRVARWAVLAPLLLAADALELCSVPLGLFAEIADALDAAAEACRPSGEVFTNPAKALAVQLADSQPVIAGAGPLASVAASLFADDLRLFAGSPAAAISLPDDLPVGAALLAAGSDDGAEADFFRDRDRDGTASPCLVAVGDDGDPFDPVLGDRSTAQLQLDELPARRALDALRELARAHAVPVLRVDVPQGPPLVRLAVASAIGSFASAYVALGHGGDPSAPRPGELVGR
jgi:hypothetical protein